MPLLPYAANVSASWHPKPHDKMKLYTLISVATLHRLWFMGIITFASDHGN
jgi:hypothetical protein